MFTSTPNKSVLNSTRPNERNCEACPRWLSMCKEIFNEVGELPKVETCPIWNGSYDVQHELWYHQEENQDETLSEFARQVELVIKRINEYVSIKTTCKIVDDNNYIVYIDYKDINLGILPLHIEKRKIDIIVHDGEFLCSLLTRLNLMTMFVKSFQYMKIRFKKTKLIGSSNKIFFETFDSIKLDELVVDYLQTYNKVLDGILFTLEINDTRITLDSIY